ncbi:MAG: hypothetical protein ABL956_18340 [Hyphomonadaceae bacterium]
MSIRLVYSQMQTQKVPSEARLRIDVGDVTECVLRKLIAEEVLSKAQVIIAIEDALIELGEAVDEKAERRMFAMINTLASMPAGPGKT